MAQNPFPSDPVALALAKALPDDEPVKAEDHAAIERARQEVARGDTLSTEELLRELGLR